MKLNEAQAVSPIQSADQAKIDNYIMKKLAKSSSAKYIVHLQS